MLADWGPISFLEIGPSTIEAQSPPDLKTKLISIEPPNVVSLFKYSTASAADYTPWRLQPAETIIKRFSLSFTRTSLIKVHSCSGVCPSITSPSTPYASHNFTNYFTYTFYSST